MAPSSCNLHLWVFTFKIREFRQRAFTASIQSYDDTRESACNLGGKVFCLCGAQLRCLEIASARTLPDAAAWRQLASRCNIDLTLHDSADALIVCSVAHKINVAVFKIQIRINSALIDIDRILPFPINIIRPHIEVFAQRIVGGGHVESTVIIPYGVETPPELFTLSSSIWLFLVRQWPIWVQFIRSLLSKRGTPGSG